MILFFLNQNRKNKKKENELFKQKEFERTKPNIQHTHLLNYWKENKIFFI
jgi:hypothetical protein